jgi:hypothetical protein
VNICSVTSQGHPYAIFRRALERRNLPSAWAAASELQVVSLADALALCLLVRDREPAKFARLALALARPLLRGDAGRHARDGKTRD